MVDRAEHVDAVAAQRGQLLLQHLDRRHLQGQVLGPVGVGLLVDVGLVDQVEEGHPAPVVHLEEEVAVGGVLLGRRYPVLDDDVGQLQAEHVPVELGGLLGVAAPVGHVVESLDVHSRPLSRWSRTVVLLPEIVGPERRTDDSGPLRAAAAGVSPRSLQTLSKDRRSASIRVEHEPAGSRTNQNKGTSMTITESTPSGTVDNDSVDRPAVDNGVNVEALLGARQAMTEMPAAAQFTWKASSEWVNGTHTRVSVQDFFGVGDDQSHVKEFVYDADHPELFAAPDNGITPVEYILVGLAGCLTAGVASVAQNREIQLRSVKATLSGDMDMAGILGIDPDVRNGYSGVTVAFEIDADATAEEIEGLVAQSQKRSAVYDILTNPTPVTVEVN